jgi:hypothetical protein
MRPVQDALQPRHAARFRDVQRAAGVLVWLGVAACVAGVATTQLWRQAPWGRFAESLLLAALVALAAWPLQRWRGWPWAGAMAAIWYLLLVAMGGVLPMAATLLVLGAAIALGSFVAPAQPVLACVCGLAMFAGALGWMLPLPVHRWWIYLAACLALVLGGRERLRAQWAILTRGSIRAMHASPRAAALAVVALGIASSAAWPPTLQFDDLAYHLGLPWQLMLHGRYVPDATQQVWAFAPWASDIVQALPQVLARAEARTAVNAAWLLATAAGLWRIGAALRLAPAMRWATVALLASLPMTAMLLGGMQTETAGAAITAWLAAIILAPVPRTRGLFAGALLFGLLCALKPTHAVAALPLLAWAAWRHRARPRAGALALAVLLVLAVGASSYTTAWLRTGNPVLPLLNDVFHSPYFSMQRFDDLRWHQGFDPRLPWRLTFHTSAYVEGWDGALGLVLVALSGAWLLALADRRTRGLAACATLAIALPLLPLQYARYVHPGLVLLLPALVAVVQRRTSAKAGNALLAAICIAGIALQANAGWMLRTGVVKRSLGALGQDAPLFERYAPERALAAAIRAEAPASGPVLLLSEPYQAEFAGRGRDIAWYAPRLEAAAAAADRDASGTAWAALLRREHIAEVILVPAALPPPRAAGLARVGAHRRLAAGDAEWWRIPPDKDAR